MNKEAKEIISQIDYLRSNVGYVKEHFNFDGQDTEKALKELDALQSQAWKLKEMLEAYRSQAV